jgi:heterodisulfide reductase subunit A-like polyferredoxin
MAVPAGNPDRAGNKRILVVGGGISGLTAAIEVAETGYEVLLVEKEQELGGWAAKLYKRVPFREPYAEPQETGLAELIARVTAHPKIRVQLASTLAETAGAPGGFAVKIAQDGGAVTHESVGAIIQASGFSTYDLAKLPELGGGLPGVVDQAGLERLAKAAKGGAIQRADGQPMARRCTAWCLSSVRASVTRAVRICPNARVTAAPPASSRPCISRTRIPTSRPWCCIRTCACPAWVKTFTAAHSARA